MRIARLRQKRNNQLRKPSPMNVSAILKEHSKHKLVVPASHISKDQALMSIMTSTSFSRNKLSKNKTLPNLFNYANKMHANGPVSTKAITKQFMNPSRKYISKQGNKTFVEPTTPGDSNLRNRVYESGSTSRSGGTGEPDYSGVKGKYGYQKVAKTMYETKINSLTKENSQVKADYQKLKKEIAAMDK